VHGERRVRGAGNVLGDSSNRCSTRKRKFFFRKLGQEFLSPKEMTFL